MVFPGPCTDIALYFYAYIKLKQNRTLWPTCGRVTSCVVLLTPAQGEPDTVSPVSPSIAGARQTDRHETDIETSLLAQTPYFQIPIAVYSTSAVTTCSAGLFQWNPHGIDRLCMPLLTAVTTLQFLTRRRTPVPTQNIVNSITLLTKSRSLCRRDSRLIQTRRLLVTFHVVQAAAVSASTTLGERLYIQ